MLKYRNLIIQEEDYLKLKPEANDLILKNWEDTGLEDLELDPDWSSYDVLYQAGCFGVYTARENNVLVGYLGVLARNHLHYKGSVFASNDVLFLDKDYRKGLAGYFLIKYSLEDLKKKGVDVFLFNSTVEKPYDPILKKLGFKHHENIYIKKAGS